MSPRPFGEPGEIGFNPNAFREFKLSGTAFVQPALVKGDMKKISYPAMTRCGGGPDGFSRGF
jgi:hypothetical protein